MAMAAMSDRSSIAKDVAKRLNISTATLYEYVNGDGSPKELATKLLTGSIN
jgi:DNA-binding transcriptional regulator YiaG